MAAVGLVLVPEGMQALPMIFIFLSFLSGVIIFLFIDQYMEKNGGTMSQLLGMVSDFIPEAITMGAVFSKNPKLGILLATIIGIQNLPESFNAYRDLKKNYSVRVCLLILLVLSFSGVIAALIGYYLLSNMPMTVAALMLFCSGGIVYLIFQDIAPMAKLKKNWIPAMGASIGFLVGMTGVKILG
jgi:zinc transporter, ZIP family